MHGNFSKVVITFLNKFILISSLLLISAFSNSSKRYGIYEYKAANEGSTKCGHSINDYSSPSTQSQT